jgi:hypothetical protein
MQTTGASLLAIGRSSPARVWTSTQDSRSAYGLLYPAAVSDDWRKHQDRRHQLANTLSKSLGLGSPRFKRVRDLGRLSRVMRAVRPRT